MATVLRRVWREWGLLVSEGKDPEVGRGLSCLRTGVRPARLEPSV